MTLDPTISSLILAGASFLVALAYSIKKARDCQLGTCCKISLGPPGPPTPTGSPGLPAPQSNTVADIAQAIMPDLV